MKILIIENSDQTRNIYQNVLPHNFDLHFELNGLDGFFAFQLAQQSKAPYDLIITDIMTPYLDGAGCINLIRLWERENKISRWRGVPIWVSTTLENYDYLLEQAHQNCDSIIFKPLSQDSLKNKVNKLLMNVREPENIFHDLKVLQGTFLPK